MLSRSALGASMRCTEARIQVAPFRDTDWVTVWLMILRRRFCPSWTARPGAPLRLRPPPAHVASAATGEEEQLFELLGLSCDPGNGMALPRALLRLPLGPGCQLEGCCIGSSDGGGGGAVFTLANSKRLILPADGAMVRERLARNLPPEALSCAQPWSGLEEPQTALHVPAGGARLDGPCELLPSATAAATAVAVHFKLPVGAGTHQKAHFEALFSWMCSSGCGVLCKSNIEFWGGANASVGSAAAVLQVVPPPPQSDVPLVAGAYQGEGNRLAPGSEADSQLQSAAGLAAVVQVQDLEAPRRGLGPSLEVGIAANGELVEAALRGRATSVPQEHGTGGTNADRVPVGNHVEPPGDAEDVCLDPGTTSWAEPMEPPSHERGSMASGVLSSRNVRWDRAASVQIIEASVYEREAGVCPAPSPTQPSAAPSPSQLLSQHQRRQQQLQQEREPPLVSTRKAASARPGGTDNALCVVCLNASPVMGFRHGHTVHCCACYPCTQQLLEQRSEQTGQGRPSQPRGNVLCPLCRQTVEDVLLIYTP
ncbi:hypothetical protein Vretimale_16487 [Volvox reticuliferus]|uniref:Uncharacterized protein n=1 Tax=Volvox reticuliferus TaxID=1737510 RepID=A0A8J4LXE7_9CHLO|nr:hypothetical protein Vretifemale_17526 [Volvox reticuliferus]GIM13431.1 hypothetical protein Vretimale_16487 [Volvox reticuliferus]